MPDMSEWVFFSCGGCAIEFAVRPTVVNSKKLAKKPLFCPNGCANMLENIQRVDGHDAWELPKDMRKD